MVSTDLAAPSMRTANVKRVRLLPLVALIFFSVSGGAYGIESLFSTSGPGIGILLIIATPILYAVPHSLVVSELGTAIPQDGGYYYWVKHGLGRFWGFQQGTLQWICSFVDMAVYPVLFTSYLQSLVASVAPGTHVLFTLGHLQFDLNWFICLAVIIALRHAGDRLLPGRRRRFVPRVHPVVRVGQVEGPPGHRVRSRRRGRVTR